MVLTKSFVMMTSAHTRLPRPEIKFNQAGFLSTQKFPEIAKHGTFVLFSMNETMVQFTNGLKIGIL